MRRLGPGDEAVAIAAIHELKPASERDGKDASKEPTSVRLEREDYAEYTFTEL